MSSLVPNLSRYETSVLNYVQPRAIDRILCLESALVNLTYVIIAMATPCVEISSDRLVSRGQPLPVQATGGSGVMPSPRLFESGQNLSNRSITAKCCHGNFQNGAV